MGTDHDNETAVARVDTLVGTVFDKRFRVDERIAAGGFGAIYRATHVKSGHRIALKVLHPTLASDLGVLARFRREGTTLTSLRNPHTITAYEFGQSERTLFIVMELLHGETLFDHYSDNGPLEWKRVVKIGLQVCESLEEAHAQGIVHRDLKPTNIHLEDHDGTPDFVKVLDFGIAKILRGSDHDSGDITNVGQMIGTLDYMSPEQMVGGNVTGQTDIYTLGIVMYEMIAGTRPFPESTTAGAALAAMLKTTPEPLYLRAPVPRPLDAAIMRCLERETTKRFRTVSELRTALERVLHDAEPVNTATVQLPKASVPLDEDDATAITPPPEKVLADLKSGRAATPLEFVDTPPLRTKPNRLSTWEDDDEQAPTTTRQPDGSDMPGAAIQQRPTPRPLASRHIENPPVPLVAAPFSPRVRPPTGPVPHNARAVALGVAPTKPMAILPPSALAAHGIPQPNHGSSPSGPVAGAYAVAPSGPHAAPAGTYPASGAPVAGPYEGAPSGPHGAPHSGPHGAPNAPRPLRGSPSTSPPPLGPPADANPFMTTSPGHAPGPRLVPAPPVLPATPVPQYIPQTPPLGPLRSTRVPTAQFDLEKSSARERAMRRLIWIIVLVLGAGVGFILATQL